MNEKNDALYREVDEELRREKFQKLWEKYGVYVVGLAFLVVAMVGGYKFWNAREQSFAEQQGALYEAALKLIKFTKNDEAKIELEKIIASGHLGYTTLAKLQLAGIHIKSNRPKDAQLILEEIEKSSSIDPIIKTYASFEVASLRLSEADFSEMENRLKTLADGPSAWRIPARELLGIAAYKHGKYEEARKILLPLLSEPQLPPGVQERTQLLLSAINAAEVNKMPSSSPSSEGNVPTPSNSAPSAPNSDAK